jgi:predicted transposase/invertase (TIGR01784 family)
MKTRYIRHGQEISFYGIRKPERVAEERGEKKGREEGREEGLIEAARKLISSGMDKKTVCEMLGISEPDLI